MQTSINQNLKLDAFIDASHLNTTIRHLIINRSIDEKDKLIDQLLIKRLERIRDNLIENAFKGLTLIKETEDAKNAG